MMHKLDILIETNADQKVQQAVIITLGELTQLREVLGAGGADPYKQAKHGVTMTVRLIEEFHSNNYGEYKGMNMDDVLEELHGIQADLSTTMLLEAARQLKPELQPGTTWPDNGAPCITGVQRAYQSLFDKLLRIVTSMSGVTYHWTVAAEYRA